MTDSLEMPPEEGESALSHGIFADLAVRSASAPNQPSHGRSVPPPPPRSSWSPPRPALPAPPVVTPKIVSPDVTLEVKVEPREPTAKAIPALHERVELPSGSSRSIPPPPSSRASALDAPSVGLVEPFPTRSSFSAPLPPTPVADVQDAAEPLSEASLALADLARLRPLSTTAGPANARRDTSGTYPKAQVPKGLPTQAVHSLEPELTDTSRQMAVDYTHVFQPASASVSPPARQPPYAALAIVALIGLCFGWYIFDTKMVPGVVQVTTTPADAEVLFDGARVGTASPFLKTGVTPGAKHSVEVKKAGHKPWMQEVELRPGQTLAFDVKLPLVDESVRADQPVRVGAAKERPQALRAQALPPSSSQATEAGEKTALAEREAPSGSANDDHSTTRSSRSSRRSSRRDQAAKSAATGTLRVSSRPWSVVFIDGKNMGNTPQTNLTLSEGTHQVRLKNPEFNVEKTVSVDIVAGETETVILNLL